MTEEHYNVWSLHLGSILLKAGDALNSLFGEMIFSSRFDDIEDVKKEREQIKLNRLQCDITNYCNAFNRHYLLYDKEIYVLTSPKTVDFFLKIIPFSNWLSENAISKYNQLEWWEAYNKIKRNRIKYKKEATLKRTAEALSALFILIILYPDTMRLLVDNSIIKSGYSKDHIKTLIEEGAENNWILQGHSTILAKTPLFGYVFKDLENQHLERVYSLDSIFNRHIFF